MVANLLRLPCIRRQRGFTLIELAVVAVIVTVLAVVAVPRVRNLVLDARVTGVARDIEAAALKIMQAREGMTPMFSGGVSQAEFGAALRSTGATSVTLTPATGTVTGITHSLGSGTGAAAVWPGAWTLTTTNDTLIVELHRTDGASCMRVAQLLAARAHAVSIDISGSGGSWRWMKPPGGRFNGAGSETICETGNSVVQVWFQ